MTGEQATMSDLLETKSDQSAGKIYLEGPLSSGV